jgi:hypothetical protein
LAGPQFYRTEWKVQDHLVQGKQKLIQYKSDHGLPLTVTNEDVMPLLNQAVSGSFAIVEKYQKGSSRPWLESAKQEIIVASQQSNLLQ